MCYNKMSVVILTNFIANIFRNYESFTKELIIVNLPASTASLDNRLKYPSWLDSAFVSALDPGSASNASNIIITNWQSRCSVIVTPINCVRLNSQNSTSLAFCPPSCWVVGRTDLNLLSSCKINFLANKLPLQQICQVLL